MKPEIRKTKIAEEPVPGCCDQTRAEAKRKGETSKAPDAGGRCCGTADKRASPRRQSPKSQVPTK